VPPDPAHQHEVLTMRVLLINPAIRPEQFGRFASLLEPMPCIGVAYVGTFLAQAGHDVEIFDDFALRLGHEAILDAVARFRPDVVGVSVLTPVALDVVALLRRVKRWHPAVRCLAGNIHADLFPHEFADTCDAVVHGEGERATVALVDAWARGESGVGIPGVTVFVDGVGERGPHRELETDLDAFPFPDWSLLPIHRYSLLPLGTVARPVVAMQASRGCPHTCEYCSLDYQGHTYRARSVGNVVDEVEHVVRRFGAKQIGFMDPIFPLGRRHAEDFGREMIRRGLHEDVVWLSELRADHVDGASLEWMQRSGCRRLVFGLEAADEGLMADAGRRTSTARCRETITRCRALGITTVGLFMIGLPRETPEQTEQTIDYACSLDLDFAKFAITVPFPGSKLYTEQAAAGRLDDRQWDAYTTYNPDRERIAIASEVQDAGQLQAALRRATMRFYLRPRVVARQLVEVRTLGARQMARGLRSLLPDLPKGPAAWARSHLR
jgi:anaerobic magnesium-protoporphyrin IX monomethyl ester cyclase